ncbi:hypothetical protein ACWD25_32830, partial [Streptomyces sp. NPDC002920]
RAADPQRRVDGGGGRVPRPSGRVRRSRGRGIARRLVVARDAKDGGGSYDISIWRQDFARPDDAVLLRLAARILPTLPGWKTTG